MRKIWAMIPAALVAVTCSQAWAGGVSFTADTVEKFPKQGVQQGRMFVSDQGVRMESSRQGQQVVQISLPKQGVMRVLMPRQRTYMEMKVPAGSGGPTAKPDNPCGGLDKKSCQRIGTEDVGGIKAEKWKISLPKATGPVMAWWDTERKMMLRQEFPDGSMAQMTYQGPTTYEGRKVEKWETLRVSAKGEQQKMQQLLDRELGITVREQYPTGAVRELRNIKIVKPNPSWFAVPQGFVKQQPQQQQAPGQYRGGRR